MSRIEISPEWLAGLKELAEKATPGPWIMGQDGEVYSEDQDDFPVDIIEGICVEQSDAAFIAAASPDVVLAMASEIERLRAENKRLLVEAHDLDSSGGEMAKDCRSLEKEADWLAGNLEKACHLVGPVCFTTARTCPIRCNVDNESTCENATTFAWRVAARYAVEKSGNLSQP